MISALCMISGRTRALQWVGSVTGQSTLRLSASSLNKPILQTNVPDTSSLSNNNLSSNQLQTGTVMAKSGIVRSAYVTQRSSIICGAHCVIVEAPTPEKFQFPDTAHLQANHHILYSAAEDDITTEEVMFGRVKEQTNKARLNKFIGGRIALRRALNHVISQAPAVQCGDIQSINTISDSGSIMRDVWGAPHLLPGITGSISHKDFMCVGAAALDSNGRVGVDLEHCNNKAAPTLCRRILTENEKQHLGCLRSLGYTTEEEVLLTFSFKEAVYKAIHPFLARSIDFGEVEVYPSPCGDARLEFLLRTGESFSYKASWERYKQKYWLTCVYASDTTGKLNANAKYVEQEKDEVILNHID